MVVTLPPLQMSFLQSVRETWGGFWVLSATQLVPWHFWQVGQVPALPTGFGLPPQCQPALITPTPGSDEISDPSSLTVPVPIATNADRSWSYEYISVTCRGASPSTFGSVNFAGGLNTVPTGWIVTTKRGCCPNPGDIGTLSPLTGVTVTHPDRDPPANVADPGAIVRANPGTCGNVSVPPVVSETHSCSVVSRRGR